MLNTIIADSDINNIKYILNKILNNQKNIKVYIATTQQEIYEILFHNKINILIINKNLKLDYNQTLFDNIILIDKNIDDNAITQNLNIINNTILSNTNTKLIKQKIEEQLMTLGYNFKYKGTKYLIDCILFVYEKNNIEILDNLEQNVYKYIAIKNNSSINNIKTTITKSTNYTYTYQDKNIFIQYFSLDIKITPKLVISTILRKLNLITD